jgi:hypothetical protein
MTMINSSNDTSNLIHYSRTLPLVVAAANSASYLALATGVITKGDMAFYLVGGLSPFAYGATLGGTAMAVFWFHAMIADEPTSVAPAWFRNGVSRIKRAHFDVTLRDVRKFLFGSGVSLTMLGMATFATCLAGGVHAGSVFLSEHPKASSAQIQKPGREPGTPPHASATTHPQP